MGSQSPQYMMREQLAMTSMASTVFLQMVQFDTLGTSPSPADNPPPAL